MFEAAAPQQKRKSFVARLVVLFLFTSYQPEVSVTPGAKIVRASAAKAVSAEADNSIAAKPRRAVLHNAIGCRSRLMPKNNTKQIGIVNREQKKKAVAMKYKTQLT